MMGRDMGTKLEIDFEIADRITIATLKDTLSSAEDPQSNMLFGAEKKPLIKACKFLIDWYSPPSGR